MKCPRWSHRIVGGVPRLIVSGVVLGAAMAMSCVTPDHDEGQVQSTVTHEAVNGDPATGKQLVRRYGCVACHRIPGSTFQHVDVGPPLDAWARRRYIAGMTENTQELLVRWIAMPQSVSPGTAMPNLSVSDEDARDIAAYLFTLR